MRVIALAFLLPLLAACGQQATPAAGSVEALEARVRALEDERAILAALDSLDLAVDRKDWAQARAQFADRIAVDFSSLGNTPGEIAADELISGWRANLYDQKPSFHLRGGAIVAIDGDRASVVSNGYAWNALPQRVENTLWEVWGRYEFRMIREGDGWKINAMTFHALHQRGDPGIRTEALQQ